jgi:site-specific recombinase XerC
MFNIDRKRPCCGARPGAVEPVHGQIKKVPATAERLLAMAANTGANLKGLRDRALLLIGFAGALRRSELVALNIEDIEEAEARLGPDTA